MSLIFSLLISCKEKINESSSLIIAEGEIPNLFVDNKSSIHLTYGKGDSILYCYSSDKGKTFSASVLVDTMPNLFSFAMRGPQIAAANNTVVIIAADQQGNIFSWQKEASGKWLKGARVNDVDTIAREGLTALGSNGDNNFVAVWLDLRNENKNNLYGTISSDGGKTWAKNFMIYTSPDGHICECCKPSVAINGSNVFVMFRNWVKGNRDLYVIKSTDGGATFGAAEKLGTGSWQLNGCPMDGGGLAIADNIVQTVWRRKNKIYACEIGKEEKEIGEGKSCTIASSYNKSVYAWVQKGKVICLLPDGKKEQVGTGGLPVLKFVSETEVLCVWEQDKKIKSKLMQL
ncbi:MAG: sialidase family protein [Ginsengibacter sp.]